MEHNDNYVKYRNVPEHSLYIFRYMQMKVLALEHNQDVVTRELLESSDILDLQ